MLSKSQIKYIQSLGHKKHRKEERQFIAEGPKIVDELLSSQSLKVLQLFATKNYLKSADIKSKPVEIFEVTEKELERISQLKTPNEVVAVVSQHENSQEINAEGKISLLLDNIQDPGNLGTIIRTADWYGISLVVCSEDCADVYNPKVVQSTMGSIARVNVCYTDAASWLSKQKISSYAAMLEGEDINKLNKLEEGIIVIGNESRGINPDLVNLCSHRITITGKGKAESLNAAVATGIILSRLT